MLFLRASCSWAFSSSGSLGLVTGGGNGGLLGVAEVGIDCLSVTVRKSPFWSRNGSKRPLFGRVWVLSGTVPFWLWKPSVVRQCVAQSLSKALVRPQWCG
eukprot:1264698-Amphidinium_carterae.1